MKEEDSAVTILEDAFVISKLIMKYAGFWPLEPMRYSDTNTWQERIIWAIGWFFLLFVPLTLAMDFMYIGTMETFDIAEFSDAMSTTVCNVYITFIIISIHLKQDEWKAIFSELYSCATSDKTGGLDQLKEDAKSVQKLSILLSAIYFVTVSGYLNVPLIENIMAHRMHPNETIPPVLIFHQWYPYDKAQTPYYQISFLIESVRCIDCTFAIGVDCLFNGVLILVIGQFSLLQRNLKNIRQIAMERLGHVRDETSLETNVDVEEEMAKLLNEYVEKHNHLIRIIDLIQEAFEVVIFEQTITHAIAVCCVLYQQLEASKSNDVYILFKTCFYQLVLIVQMYVYGYYGSELVYESQKIATAAFHSEWYLSKNTGFKKNLRMIIMRAQKPCTITAMGFAVLSLVLFINIMRTSISYFALLQTVAELKE